MQSVAIPSVFKHDVRIFFIAFLHFQRISLIGQSFLVLSVALFLLLVPLFVPLEGLRQHVDQAEDGQAQKEAHVAADIGQKVAPAVQDVIGVAFKGVRKLSRS